MIGRTRRGGVSIILPNQIISANIHKPILQDLFPVRLGYHPDAKGQSMNLEKGTPEFTLHFCVKGRGYFEFNGETYEQNEGDIIIIPPNVGHYHYADEKEPWSRYWIHYIGRQSDAFSELLGVKSGKPFLSIPSDSDLMNAWEEIYKWYNEGFIYENLVGASIACSRFLGRVFYLQTKRANMPKTAIDNIQLSIDFMKNNLHQSYKLEQLADNAHLSPTHYRSLFKQVTDMSPIDYFIHLKMTYARELLDQNEYTVQEVAEEVGYSDPFYFSRIFKKISGSSPSEYRKKIKR